MPPLRWTCARLSHFDLESKTVLRKWPRSVLSTGTSAQSKRAASEAPPSKSPHGQAALYSENKQHKDGSILLKAEVERLGDEAQHVPLLKAARAKETEGAITAMGQEESQNSLEVREF